MSDHLVWNVIYPEAPESFHENPKADPHWQWAKEPEVREAVRPQVAELARVATFLASEGTSAVHRTTASASKACTYRISKWRQQRRLVDKRA